MDTEKQERKQYDWLKEYQWQKGQSGNPNGRPKGKTMKEFAREFLMSMSEESRIEYLQSIDPDVVWKMAEGNPHNTSDVEVDIKPKPLLDALRDNNSHKEDSQTEGTD